MLVMGYDSYADKYEVVVNPETARIEKYRLSDGLKYARQAVVTKKIPNEIRVLIDNSEFVPVGVDDDGNVIGFFEESEPGEIDEALKDLALLLRVARS